MTPEVHQCLTLGTMCCIDVLCLHAGNMMLFDADGKIKRYDSPEEILTEFFDLRLQYYERRRVGLLQVSYQQ